MSIANTLSRLGLNPSLPPSAQALSSLYRSWCLHVPFDNIRKTTALFSGANGTLPGIEPSEFFESFLEHGSGGTCWATSNALYTLCKQCGFDALRGTASMFDMGNESHAVVIVRVDGRDWLLDSSLLTMNPLPLVKGESFVQQESVYCAEVDPEGDSFYVWAVAPPLEQMIVFRLLHKDVSEDVYRANYESSREMSVFNARLYVRRNYDDRIVNLLGNMRFELGPNGLQVSALSGDELVSELVGPLGYSTLLISKWKDAGVLDASLEPADGPPNFPTVDRIPPSKR